MRILMIIDGLPGGGAEKTVLTLSSGLIEMGHQVSLFSLRKVCDYAIPEGIDFQVIQDTCTKPWRKLTEIPRRAQLLDSAVKQAEQSGKFDVVFSHLHKTDRIVSHSRALSRDKVWFCVHGMFSFSYLRHRSGLSRWFKHLKIRHTYENRNVVAVSAAVLRDLSDTLNIQLRRKTVIHNPFDISEIQRLADTPFNMQGKDYIIHVGRFHEHKRHDRLLRAYALSHIDAPLVMMGNGSDTRIQQLKQLAAELGIEHKIIIRPFEANPYPWIKGARLLVLSSDCEGFGNVLVESIICQTPPVSTNCPGGPAEILTGPLSRGLSELNDESLAKTLADIYANPPIVNTATISSFGINAICQQYIALVDKQ
ncbi:glycosyltransferase [Lelliottia sp. V89_10]|uniref:glycosyltransferase n=1 Tax=Lelliottia wanjuensis TaxID=3050585 RepID=UPI00249EA35D|nr:MULTISPECIES: glycosyltransferase [unclassified Lelliottia]MDI3359317.1 glycosyltransferase [Lelliottia sp. V89_13]MDK9550001.1 glycosyltransferase [Lelliottia sp. V89_5]MDK9596335.1 glycosyltransferase [Lelliottia sp. V89_10]